YQDKNDQGKIIEFGEKAIKIDPVNIDALLALTRAYSLDGKAASLDRAIAYSQKAIDQCAKMKNGPPQQGYTNAQWKEVVERYDSLAKNYQSYAKSLKR